VAKNVASKEQIFNGKLLEVKLMGNSDKVETVTELRKEESEPVFVDLDFVSGILKEGSIFSFYRNNLKNDSNTVAIC
jgi:glycerol-3-phosphate responsive antiterminator